MTWTVQLTGDPADLAALSLSLKDADLTISHDGQDYVLTSNQFGSISEAGSVRERAQALMQIVNGATRLALESRQLIGVGAVYRRNALGGRDIFVFPEPAVVHIRAMAPTIRIGRADGTVEEFHPADPVADWAKLAAKERAVATALQIIAGGAFDWVNLYRLFEVVEADAGGIDAIASAGWASANAMKLFKRTANSPGAIGLDARHGTQSTQPPPKAMSLAEARSIITSLTHAWLRSKT